MAHTNHMKLNGKTATNPNAILTINLADDHQEVRGFGQPITPDCAVKMADDYFKQCKAAWHIISQIKNNSMYAALKGQTEFAQLESLIDPANQTVSGVFGKEIILQILAQKNCEGIRYVHGKDKDRNTIILLGVGETGTVITRADGSQHAGSEPVKFKVGITEEGDIPVIGEVHEDSLTIEGVERLMSIKINENFKNTDITFGIF